jgi:hypothetical protein
MVYDQEVMGSNPGTVYWMDVSDLLAITLKKNWKIKVAKWGTPKKYNKKSFKFLQYLSISTFPTFIIGLTLAEQT